MRLFLITTPQLSICSLAEQEQLTKYARVLDMLLAYRLVLRDACMGPIELLQTRTWRCASCSGARGTAGLPPAQLLPEGLPLPPPPAARCSCTPARPGTMFKITIPREGFTSPLLSGHESLDTCRARQRSRHTLNFLWTTCRPHAGMGWDVRPVFGGLAHMIRPSRPTTPDPSLSRLDAEEQWELYGARLG